MPANTSIIIPKVALSADALKGHYPITTADIADAAVTQVLMAGPPASLSAYPLSLPTDISRFADLYGYDAGPTAPPLKTVLSHTIQVPIIAGTYYICLATVNSSADICAANGPPPAPGSVDTNNPTVVTVNVPSVASTPLLFYLSMFGFVGSGYVYARSNASTASGTSTGMFVLIPVVDDGF